MDNPKFKSIYEEMKKISGVSGEKVFGRSQILRTVSFKRELCLNFCLSVILWIAKKFLNS